jgi:hypothetical protein
MTHESDVPAPGRTIPDPGFAGDDGAAPAALTAALAAYGCGQGHPLEVFAELQHARLLVPVLAILGEVELDEDGRAHDKTSDMATALLTGADGRLALLAFTSLATMARWRDTARPVPVAAPLAARSALQEGAAALLVDVAGPTPYVVEGGLLEGLARGWTLTASADGPAWSRPAEGDLQE